MASAHELPYFPFYPRDFASDNVVEGMSTKAIGAYVLLLCKAWFETPPGTIPDDDAILSRWARMSELEWGQIKGEVLAAFGRRDGRWVQKRMVAEWAEALDKHERRVAAGRSGGEAKARQHPSNALAMLPQCSSIQNQNQIQNQNRERESTRNGQCEPEPKSRLLLWNHVQPVYDAYPAHRRGGKGGFAKAVAVAWRALEDDGEPDPQARLVRIVRAYAGSWLAKQDGGKAVLGAERFFADGAWQQDPKDWAKPGEAGSSTPEQRERTAKRAELMARLNLLTKTAFRNESDEQKAKRTSEVELLRKELAAAT